MSEANYSALYSLAKEWLKTQDGGLRVAAILPLATHLMANAQAIFGPNRGAEKKAAVLRALRALADEFAPEADRPTYDTVLNVVAPPAIDAIIALAVSGRLSKWWRGFKRRFCGC
jgi:hypothetical protein